VSGHRRRRSRFGPGEIRVALLGGVFIGLAAAAYRPAAAVIDSVSSDGVAVTGPVRVIDGDTFEYGGDRIRIADIDTPEVRGRCAYESELAARATSRMRDLLSEGPFELHPIGGRDEDQYGRKLRIVTRGGQSLGDTLVAEGLARTWTGRREPWCV
jgi:endonuclease YncB( thermonuclease family)